MTVGDVVTEVETQRLSHVKRFRRANRAGHPESRVVALTDEKPPFMGRR